MSECFYLTWHCLYISPPVNCYYIYLILLNSLSLQHTCFLLINWFQGWYCDLQGYSTWMQGLPFHFVYLCWIILHDCLVIWFLTSLRVRPIISICFDISIPYLAHGSITKRGCVKYIHDLDMTLTFVLKVKFIGFMTLLCVQASPFLSIGIVILCYACGCVTMVRCVT